MQINKLRNFVIIIALIGITALYQYSLTTEPAEIKISQLKHYEGQYVVVQGNVLEMKSKRGGASFTIIQENSTARIFLDTEEESVCVGDKVEVMGKVTSYNGIYSISVSGRNNFRIISRWENNVTTLPSLSVNPWESIGLNFNISCSVGGEFTEKDHYSFFIVTDSEHLNYSVVVFVYGLDPMKVHKGANIFLNARLEYNHENMEFYLVMDSKDHCIWKDKMSDYQNK